jgi:KaiC/GvpD/RAD55 family RecA-like ATPase
VLTLGQAVSQQGVQGASIATPYTSLTNLGFTLRRGQTSMVVAGPGTGKSALALDIAMRLHLRSLYISADTDSFTMGLRAAAKMSGHPQEQIEKGMADPTIAPMYQDLLAKLWNVRFSFDAACMEDVRDEVFAYATAFGSFPPLLVVDNLVNVADGDDDYKAMRHAVQDLDRLAHNTGSHVMILHHANGRYENGDEAIPLSGLENKVGKIPAQVITLTRVGNYMRVHPVKNRSGKADPKGGLSAQLYVDLATMTFRES